jgi:hypothetical protein
LFYNKIRVKKPVLLIESIIRELHGNAYLSLEGDLAEIYRANIRIFSEEETSLLKRQIKQMQAGFIILAINDDTKDEILRILPAIGIKKKVVHIQIEKDGELMFGAYDNFEFVGMSAQVSEDTLNRFIQRGIIKSYTLRGLI